MCQKRKFALRILSYFTTVAFIRAKVVVGVVQSGADTKQKQMEMKWQCERTIEMKDTQWTAYGNAD